MNNKNALFFLILTIFTFHFNMKLRCQDVISRETIYGWKIDGSYKTRVVETVFYDSTKVEERTYFDSVLHSVATYRYKNDTLMLHGPSFEYNQNSTISDSMFYINGVISGIAKAYYADGKISSILRFKNGMLHGALLEYHNNGKLRIKGRYKRGYQIGIWRYYYENGKLNERGRFERTRKIMVYEFSDIDTSCSGDHRINPFFDNSGIIFHTDYQPRKGVWKLYNCNGRLMRVFYFRKKTTSYVVLR